METEQTGAYTCSIPLQHIVQRVRDAQGNANDLMLLITGLRRPEAEALLEGKLWFNEDDELCS